MPLNKDIKKVLVIGSGPIVIGQAAEFDYSGTQACQALKEEGIEVVLVNSNPATIMTDREVADKIYIEPLTLEFVEKVIAKERPDSLLAGMGGQTGLNLAVDLHDAGILEKYNVKVIGTSISSIKEGDLRDTSVVYIACNTSPMVSGRTAEWKFEVGPGKYKFSFAIDKPVALYDDNTQLGHADVLYDFSRFRYNLENVGNKNYMGISSWIRTGNIMNKDFCFDKLIYETDPFDFDTFNKSKTDFYAVVTNVVTGKAEYIKIDDIENMKNISIKYLYSYCCEVVNIKEIYQLNFWKTFRPT